MSLKGEHTPLERDAARDAKLRRREQRTHANMLRVYGACAETLRRLYLPVGDPLRHPDADRTWSECSMQTRAALALAKTQVENPQADVKQVFGIVIMQSRSKSAVEWEKKAKKIDLDQRAKAIDAIVHTKPANTRLR